MARWNLSQMIYKAYRHIGWQVNKKLRKFTTVRTRQGVFKVSLSDEVIGKHLYCSGEFELDLIRNAFRFLREQKLMPPRGEGTILDIGANNGVISIGALHTGELERAIAIEPDPVNLRLLQCNVGLNRLADRVYCLPYAVSDREGEVELEICETNSGDHRIRIPEELRVSSAPELFSESQRRVITVPSGPLDELLLGVPREFVESIAVVWVDVQGYEGYVFKGARELISKGLPVVAEIWPYGIHRAGMTQEQFCQIAAEHWTTYWVWRRWRFIGYPVDHLDLFFDELGWQDGFGNVIFT